jgi:rod shape determining protein RodA
MNAPTIDWTAILIYLALVVIGWFNLYAVSHSDASASAFVMDSLYGRQLTWIGVTFCVAVVLLLIDERFYHMLSYPAYFVGLAVLLLVLVFGKEVNGAKAWIEVGPLSLQPGEFAKFTTSLAIARYMSKFSFSIRNTRDLIMVAGIIGTPMLIILMQRDAGSALVYASLLLMLYREGLNGWVYAFVFALVALFFMSIVMEPFTVLVITLLVCTIGEGLRNGHWKEKAIYLAVIALGTIAGYLGLSFFMEGPVSAYLVLLVCSVLSLVLVAVYAYRNRLRNVFMFMALFATCIVFAPSVDYVFDNIVQPHQRDRILVVVSDEVDLKKEGYNYNQSLIAIGSGGLTGKGFMQGTQTQFNFVPEQSTDFIFCTVGEEWGFVGSAVVVVLFCLMILRLIRMGERQRDPFRRIYCYSVASIFFMHAIINIGMTIGLVPVIGIPLPLFSYGGSSFLAFSILFFVAVRLDAGKRELMRT